MKKATVAISFDQEKLKAIQFYAGKTGTSLESDLDEFMEKLYKRYVPVSYTHLGAAAGDGGGHFDRRVF